MAGWLLGACSAAPTEPTATAQPSVSTQKLASLSNVRANLASTPRGFAIVNGAALFFSAEHMGLFRSDGTPGGTQLLRDLEPTIDPTSPTPRIVALGNKAYWTIGGMLWTSDGTGAGTALVTRFADPFGAGLGEIGVFQGAMYFGTAGGLVRSDGTAIGTRVIAAQFTTSGPWQAAGNKLYFPCATANERGELCVSDGTGAGTTIIKDLAPGASSSPIPLGAVGDRMLFSAIANGGLRGLWSTDGTAAGTVELLPAPIGDAVREGVVPAFLDGNAWLPCFTRTTGAELCRTDGTVAGTAVLDVVPGAGSLDPSDVAVIGGRLVFAAHQDNLGTELWSSDGTVAGTALVADLAPGLVSGIVSPRMIALGTQVLFAARTADGEPTSLWRTDGTAAGTVQLHQIVGAGRTAAAFDLSEAIVLGTRLLFAADDGDAGLEPWVSDGTTGGTRLLADLRPARAITSLFELRDHHGASYLTSSARDLWRTDGTLAGTTVFQTGALTELTSAGHWMFYQGGGLWRTDGEPATHFTLPGRASSINMLGDRIVFAATTPALNRGVWVSDGTEAGTQLTDPVVNNADSLTVVNGKLWVSGLDGNHGNELWVGDGSVTGIHPVTDIRPGAGNSGPAGFAALGNSVVFSANDGTTGRELWKSDGTAEGTVRIADLFPGTGSSAPGHFLAWNGHVLFTAAVFDDITPFITDGTPAGTVPLTRAAIDDDTGFVAWGNFVYFRAVDERGAELWRSDGTAAGTVIVSDLSPGSLGSDPQLMRLVSPTGPLVFAAEEPAAGRELWQLTTPTGEPQLLADLVPGPRSSRPTGIGVQGRALIVTADTGDGYGIYRVDGVGSDGTAPTLSCPDVTVVTTDPTATATFRVTASDDSGIAPVVTSDRASGSVFPFGDTTVSVAATDGSNNTARCTFVVHVVDHEPIEDGGVDPPPDAGSNGPDPKPDGGVNNLAGDGGGCSTTGAHSAGLLVLAGLLLRRRRR